MSAAQSQREGEPVTRRVVTRNTVSHIRLINVRRLKAEVRLLSAFAVMCDISPSLASQIVSMKNPFPIGGKLARKIEAACGKPLGWLDWPHGLTNPFDSFNRQGRSS